MIDSILPEPIPPNAMPVDAPIDCHAISDALMAIIPAGCCVVCCICPKDAKNSKEIITLMNAGDEVASQILNGACHNIDIRLKIRKVLLN